MDSRPDGPTPPTQRQRRLPLLNLPRPALAYVIAVETLAIALVVAAPTRAEPAQIGLAALLVAACILQHEAALSAERGYRRATIKRESATETGHLVTNSVYTVVAALLFPPALIAATVAAIYGYRILRIDRPRIPRERGPVYRTIFTASTVVIAGIAAHYLAAALGLDLAAGATTLVPIASTVLALLAYTSVQAGLVAGIVFLAAGRLAARDMVTDLRQHGFELAQLCIGAVVAFMLASSSPWPVLLLVPTLWLLSRSVLVSTVGTTDHDDGLLSPGTWHRAATAELQRARKRGTALGVLAVDLDGFRRINDAWGVRAGDHLLDEVARILPTAVRAGDIVGRMHGEEFVIAAPAADRHDLEVLGERVTAAVAAIDTAAVLDVEHGTAPRLTASVGAAGWPDAADSIDQLLTRADAELNRAKSQGVGTVSVATTAVTSEAAAMVARTTAGGTAG
ncbi:diguanylate cyclase [Pseudonocardia sp. McavD-2-B]|jgi:diguanylate cyclase (GGDEF)-like protein|uniref:GGDEF domain-containing protein n=1 Tax=Pseudonocardia sp. McavD-2-B TaxID=2954499 RepID=UPI002096DA20|nr:GGDEF domain-containing protein [Pseudonocardia sp. McavD-2-B]MCO7192322.1 GGDEF domain-containing protein [Pseudonocardia sp. McavD-2-B]